MPHASPTIAAASTDTSAALKTSTQTAMDSLTGWINDSDSTSATTKSSIRTFFVALQTALPIIQARLEPLDGSLTDLITATDAVVTALT